MADPSPNTSVSDPIEWLGLPAALHDASPDPEAAEPATLLAACALLRGDGALAGIVLDRAQQAWPGHRLSGRDDRGDPHGGRDGRAASEFVSSGPSTSSARAGPGKSPLAPIRPC